MVVLIVTINFICKIAYYPFPPFAEEAILMSHDRGLPTSLTV